MQSLRGWTEQSRGQRLNGLVAEMLRCWGFSADDGIRGAGEIDVSFTIDAHRFVLEAKWERERTGTDPIAKLQKRLRQRIGGTLGVVLSMAGYSPAALRDLKQGERLELLLLDRSHLEAMVTGFIPPEELLAAALDRAAFEGVAYSPVQDLFGRRRAPDLMFLRAPELPDDQRIPGSGEVVLSGLPPTDGMTAEDDQTLVVTTPDCIARVNLHTQSVSVLAPFPLCSRSPIFSDGAVYVVRGTGVARLDKQGIAFVAGPITGGKTLARGNGSDIWVFSNGADSPGAGRPTMTRVDGTLGVEGTEIDLPPHNYAGVAWTEGSQFAISGNGPVRGFDVTSGEEIWSAGDLSNAFAAETTLPAEEVYLAGGTATLYRLDLLSYDLKPVHTLSGFHGAVYGLSRSPRYLFWACCYSTPRGQTFTAIVRMQLPLTDSS